MAGYSFGNGVILRRPGLQRMPRAFAFISPSLQDSCIKEAIRPRFLITG